MPNSFKENNKPTIYLAGAMADCSDEECYTWRDKVTSALQHKYNILSPMVRDYRYCEYLDDPQIYNLIVDGDKGDINKSEVLFVHYIKPSVGTSMEIMYAYDRGKLILITVENEDKLKLLSPWIRFHASHVYGSLDKGIEFLNKWSN